MLPYIGISIQDSDSKIKLVDLTSDVGQAVATTFKNTWARQKGICPPINSIFSVVNTSLRQTWHKYKATLSVQNVLEYFHGTTLECNITVQQTLCSNTECGVCGIANVGLDRRCIRKNIDFQRFGHGFYVAPNSSKCHDYTRGKYGFRAMILFDVCPGNKYDLQRDDETLTQPPSGYNSVHGKAGFSLNYDELVVYNPDGAFPKYIILYQRDGENRIAQNLKSTIKKTN